MAEDNATRVAQLSDDRRRLLELMRQRRQAARPERLAAAARPAGGRLPLSVAQEQLWFLTELQAEQPTYNVGQASTLTGPLDRSALRRALDRLVARHDALRITFGTDEGRPYQVVGPAGPACLEFDDLSGSPEPDARGFELLQDKEVHRPFDLRTGPLFRARVVRLGPERHLLCLFLHHIIGDGWSLSLVVRELAELYRAEVAGEAPDLPEVGLQYSDFVLWQRRQLDGAWMDEHLSYWERRLADLPPLDLPTDHPRPASATFNGATIGYDLRPEAWDLVGRCAAACGVNRYAVLVAGFNAMLARYAGSADIVTGTTLSGRSRAELEPIVGYFANMGVMRVDTSGDPTFATLVRRASEACLGALEHQDAPFEQVVERLAPARDPSRNPLFQVAFQLLDQQTWVGPSLPGLTAEPVDLRLGRARFDLLTSVIGADGRYTSLTEFCTDLFDADRVRRMLGHFERMLLAGAREPETVLSALPMLDDAERATVLANARGPELDYRRRPVHHLVAEQAARTPGAVAVRSGDREVTYAQLSTMAGALSAALSGRGAGKGEIVASLFDRGIDEIVAILGILGAGGVYAPLDPAAPPGRLASIVARAGISRVVSHSDQLSLVPEGTDLLLTDRDPLVERGGGWDAGVDADSVAYALHTSGSTGVPKATLLTHGALANYLAWMTRDWSLGPGDRVLHVCAPVFDLAAAEILASLTTGASVVVASRDVLLSPGTLAELLAAERVTHLFVTPTVLSLVEPAPFPDLREVMVGGELCPPDLPSRWARPGRHVRNLYGPTETTIGCTVFDATGWTGAGAPPIGRPMPNRSVYVLEPGGEPAPVGVPGEIVVGGTGVGLGYLNDPERTAAAFVPDPFQPPGQLYRTGDLAFWTAGGQLQYVGRRDTQVKLRGLRIELGEIEAALARHPGVAGVAVAVRLDDAGVQQLVAYLVPAAGTEPPAPADLRSFLAGALPASMVPGWYQFLDKLPMTATDKVDRKALPPLARTGGPSGERPLVAPRTEAERHVVDAFAAVLGLDRVSVEDSFFDLGGHSLQAAYVLARLARTTGVSVALKAFYAQPGVAAVARLLSSAGASPSARSTLVTIKEAGSRPRVFCPHAVSGSPYWYVGLSRALHKDRPMDSFEAPGMEGEEPPIEDLRTLAARYVAELRRRQPAGPYLLAGWSMGGFLAFEMGRQLVAAGEAPTPVVMIDSNAPGPLPRPSEYDIMQTFVNDMAGVAGLPSAVLDPAVPSLGPRERLARLRETLVSSRLVPPDIAEEFITNRFAVFRANVLAIYAYQPETYPGEVVMFQAADEESRAPWSAYAGGGYTEVVLPGTHYSMWSPANLPRLAEALERHLTAAVSPAGAEQ